MLQICSLLPSAAEIIFAVGASDLLVGVSHECDYPADAARLPKVTCSKIAANLPSEQIDAAVRLNLADAGSLYELDLALLERLGPI